MTKKDLDKEILEKRIQFDFRAEQVKTVLLNRIWSCKASGRQDIANVYRDCLDILYKEFFVLDLPEGVELIREVHAIKDAVVEKICPVDARARSVTDYRKNTLMASRIAPIIEALCYKMFNHGYRYSEEQKQQKEKADEHSGQIPRELL